jgi:hypothetical protein
MPRRQVSGGWDDTGIGGPIRIDSTRRTRGAVTNPLPSPPPYSPSEYHLTFLKSALKYSSALGTTHLGSLSLHFSVGSIMWDSSDRVGGCVHFALAEQPGEIISRLFSAEAQVEIGERERDAIFMMAGLNFVVLENFRDATKMAISYKIKMGEIEDSEPQRPAVFLLWMLEILKREKAGRLYQWLVNEFKELQMLNNGIPQLLQRIGKTYFGLKPPPNMMNMLEQMMGGGM